MDPASLAATAMRVSVFGNQSGLGNVARSMKDLAVSRLRSQRLIGRPFESPVDAVRCLTAVQSQDYAAAKWALGQRSRGATDAEIDRLFDRGDILRTHVMRPTWHFVLPEDIRWLLALTAPRIRQGLVARHRMLELDAPTITRASAAFAKGLAGGRHLTRLELGQVLRAARISPEGQRLPHLLMLAELDGLIASGPRRGKQFTYALLVERVPESRNLERADAVAELTRRYFLSHGPAQLQDLVWWSGLTVADARAGIKLIGPSLEHIAVDGRDYWFDSDGPGGRMASPVGHLLPNFDEYTVAYRDRSSLVHPDLPVEPGLFAFGSVLSNVVTIDGRVRGAWRRMSTAQGGVQVEVRVIKPLESREVTAVEGAGLRMSRFLERPVAVGFQKPRHRPFKSFQA